MSRDFVAVSFPPSLGLSCSSLSKFQKMTSPSPFLCRVCIFWHSSESFPTPEHCLSPWSLVPCVRQATTFAVPLVFFSSLETMLFSCSSYGCFPFFSFFGFPSRVLQFPSFCRCGIRLIDYNLEASFFLPAAGSGSSLSFFGFPGWGLSLNQFLSPSLRVMSNRYASSVSPLPPPRAFLPCIKAS